MEAMTTLVIKLSSSYGFIIMRGYWILLSFLFFISACSKTAPFNKEQWAITEDGTYPYRKAMVRNLLEQYPLQGISYKELSDLLGAPQGYENNKLLYTVDIRYGLLSVDPSYIENIEVFLSPDSTLKSIELKQYQLE